MTTFLDGVNAVLMRAGILAADGLLPTFDDTAKQIYIDLAMTTWNETVDEVCNLMGVPHSGETGSSTVTLVSGQREYDLPSDLVQLRWPLIDQTNGYTIKEYPGGYETMRIEQEIPSDWTGLPYFAAINPTTSDLRMDRAPTSDEAGISYAMIYDNDLWMTDETDAFPFSDSVYRALVPVVTELW